MLNAPQVEKELGLKAAASAADTSSKRAREEEESNKLAALVEQTQATEAQLRALWPRLHGLRRVVGPQTADDAEAPGAAAPRSGHGSQGQHKAKTPAGGGAPFVRGGRGFVQQV